MKTINNKASSSRKDDVGHTQKSKVNKAKTRHEKITKKDYRQVDPLRPLPPEVSQHILAFLDSETLLESGRAVWPHLIPDYDGFWRAKCLESAPHVPVYRKTIDNINIRYVSLSTRPNLELTEEQRSRTPHEKLFINYRRILADLTHVKKYCSRDSSISDREYVEMEDRVGYLGYFDLDTRKHGERNVNLEDNIIQCIRFVLRSPNDTVLSDPIETIDRDWLYNRDIFFANPNAFGDRPEEEEEEEEVEPEGGTNERNQWDDPWEHPDSPLKRAKPTRINVFGTWAWASVRYTLFGKCESLAADNIHTGSKGIPLPAQIRTFQHLPLIIEKSQAIERTYQAEFFRYQAGMRMRMQNPPEEAGERVGDLFRRALSWVQDERLRDPSVKDIRVVLRPDRKVYLEYTYHNQPPAIKLFTEARSAVLERNREASEGAELLPTKRSLRPGVRQKK